MEPEVDDAIVTPFNNPLILDSIFKNLTLNALKSCRVVNKLWYSASTTAIRQSLKTRLLLCADSKCTTNLQNFISIFRDTPRIPISRAILVLDHLPMVDANGGHEHSQGEMELLLQLSDLFSDHLETHSETEHYSAFHFPVVQKPPQAGTGNTIKLACDLFSESIENLIINLTRHRDNSENIEYWLKTISFANLTKLSFHISRTSPEKISAESLQVTLNNLPHLKTLGIRKLTKKGNHIMNSIFLALKQKANIFQLKNLSIEAFTDDKQHLEILLQIPFYLENLSMIYLGGEIRFVEKMALIKQFLGNLSRTLKHLHTHLPLFSSSDSRNFPTLPELRALKIEKVYREFSTSQAQLFGFNFHSHFPNLESITFKDYDLWKNMQLKTFPLEEIIPSPQLKIASLPDLCFDAPLMERYFMKFHNLTKLSIIVSYVSRYQRQCSFCVVYISLPNLKELNVSIFEMDLVRYDHIFTGLSEAKCQQLTLENKSPDINERELSIVMLKELQSLKVVCAHGKKVLGISDLSVKFAFLQMASLRNFTIGSCLISLQGFAQMAEKFDVITIPNTSSSKDSKVFLKESSSNPICQNHAVVVPDTKSVNHY